MAIQTVSEINTVPGAGSLAVIANLRPKKPIDAFRLDPSRSAAQSYCNYRLMIGDLVTPASIPASIKQRLRRDARAQSDPTSVAQQFLNDVSALLAASFDDVQSVALHMRALAATYPW